ncbi:hypothetical protein SAMN04488043_11616 [Thalassovita gelatinovora]|uniref:hypothetical protein n=1 Tax=Thalassovita gelatinovora TaxID=53501 RepID=UPI0008C81FDE|nr:hypothetical protein [Thalassovita gelatinovora]QIZ82663.1 hypothetical protein HFZ77_19005 [Thalassovita gelatinovora]SER11081.1 hypothetical protein SAMN04488043_11616 [Thalassovita gelatinovora]
MSEYDLPETLVLSPPFATERRQHIQTHFADIGITDCGPRGILPEAAFEFSHRASFWSNYLGGALVPRLMRQAIEEIRSRGHELVNLPFVASGVAIIRV